MPPRAVLKSWQRKILFTRTAMEKLKDHMISHLNPPQLQSNAHRRSQASRHGKADAQHLAILPRGSRARRRQRPPGCCLYLLQQSTLRMRCLLATCFGMYGERCAHVVARRVDRHERAGREGRRRDLVKTKDREQYVDGLGSPRSPPGRPHRHRTPIHSAPISSFSAVLARAFCFHPQTEIFLVKIVQYCY